MENKAKYGQCFIAESSAKSTEYGAQMTIVIERFRTPKALAWAAEFEEKLKALCREESALQPPQ